VGEPFAVVVVAVRDPLTSYLELIRALKLHVNEPTVLAVFSGGELPADLARSRRRFDPVSAPQRC
jgi:hypothetical protein